jgi:hypothetical protein
LSPDRFKDFWLSVCLSGRATEGDYKKGRSKMVYTIGFGMRNDEVSTAQTVTAKEALELAEALQRSDEEIKFIDTPTDGRVGMDMLWVLAKEEE